MAPARSKAPIPTSSSPLFQRTLAEGRKRLNARGKKTSAATPKQSGNSTYQNTVSQPTPPTPASTPDASADVGAITRSRKRKIDAAFEASLANQGDVATTNEGDVLTTHEEDVPTKKQKRTPVTQSSAAKRKRTEEDLVEEEEKDTPRPVKRPRSSASKNKMVKKDAEKEMEQTKEVVSASSTQAMLTVENRSTIEKLILAGAKDVKDVEEIHSVKLKSNEDWHELHVKAKGFTSIRYAPASTVSATQTDRHNSEGKHADNTGSTKVNQEERKGEEDGRTGLGEKDKKEENKGKGKLVRRRPSSRHVKKSKTSRSRRTHRDVFYVSDDYDTETGEPLNNHRDSDYDFIDSDSDIIDSDSDIIDSDSDLASTPATTPSESKRPYSPGKKATTSTTTLPTTIDTAISNDNEDDDIPTICSKKVYRELVGLLTKKN